MEKKRRDFINCELVNLTKYNKDLVDCISIFYDSTCDGSGMFLEYKLKEKFGKGRVSLMKYSGVEVRLCDMELHRDLVIYDETVDDVVEISFLIDGQRIISLKGAADLLNESQEAYTVRIESFTGYIRITGNRLFRELKIKFPTSYLKKHGFMDLGMFKGFENNVIHSISNEELAVIMSIQQTALEGLPKRVFVEAKILELLALQVATYEKGQNRIFGNNQDKVLKKLYTAKQLMIDNLDQNLSIKELSRKLGLNEYIFKKEFKRIFGCSVNEYYSNEKMNKAKELLKVTQLPIYEIAGEVGYKNATHFSAAFKRSYGETPKQYRVSI